MKKKIIFKLLNLKLLGSYALKLKKFLNLYRIIVGISVLSSLIYMASVWFIYGAFPEYPRFFHLNTLLFLSFSSLEFIGDLLATNLHKEILNLPAPESQGLLVRLDTLSAWIGDSQGFAKARKKFAIFFSEQSTGDSFSEQNLENQESQIPVNTESRITEELLEERNISEALKESTEIRESNLDNFEEQSQNQQNLSELENSGSAMATEIADAAMARIAEGVSVNDGDLSAFELVFDLMNDGWISGDCIQVFYTAYESSEAVRDAMDTDDRFQWVGQNLKAFNRKD
jgi:hypothetical protein